MLTDQQTNQLNNWFTHHAPHGDQAERYTRIRAAGLAFARVIMENTPGCADQTAAVRKVREAVMVANAAIACEEAQR